MRHTLALAALLLPASALAQSGSGSTPDDGAPIPEVAWEETFQGLHAVDGACEDPDAIWAFARGTVEMGRTICTSLGKIVWEDGWLIVPASQCSHMGESRDSVRLRLRMEDGAALSARRDEADEVIALRRCPHPGAPP